MILHPHGPNIGKGLFDRVSMIGPIIYLSNFFGFSFAVLTVTRLNLRPLANYSNSLPLDCHLMALFICPTLMQDILDSHSEVFKEVSKPCNSISDSDISYLYALPNEATTYDTMILLPTSFSIC